MSGILGYEQDQRGILAAGLQGTLGDTASEDLL